VGGTVRVGDVLSHPWDARMIFDFFIQQVSTKKKEESKKQSLLGKEML